MRVLSSVLDPRFGGPQKRSLSVARELREVDIETVFLIPEGDDGFARVASDEAFEIVRTPLPRIRSPTRLYDNARFLLGFRSCTKRVAAVLSHHDIDVVHANGPLNYAVALATARSGSRLVWHFNDTLTPTPLKQLSSYAARRMADQIVVAADAVHDYYFPPHVDTETIYAPVDLTEFDSANFTQDQGHYRSHLGVDEETLVVGAVGNLNPAKGFTYLLDAIASVSRQVDDLAVFIIGAKLDSQQDYYEELKNRVKRHGLQDVVTLTGWRSDVPKLLSLFDLFVLPSLTEACPIVVLEAMAMKCPVVATAVGGVPEQIPDSNHGWVVPAKDSPSLAAAITEALESPIERKRRARNARGRVESVFSLEACVDRHERVYTSLVRE